MFDLMSDYRYDNGAYRNVTASVTDIVKSVVRIWLPVDKLLYVLEII